MRETRPAVAATTMLVALLWALQDGPVLSEDAPMDAPMEDPQEAPMDAPAEAPRESPTPAEARQSLDQFFTSLAKAIGEKNAQKITGHFNAYRMVEEVDRLGLLKKVTAAQRIGLAQGMARGIAVGFAAQADTMAWARHQILRFRPLADKSEVVVLLRAWDRDGLSQKMRWWLTKNRDGRWQAYDMQEMESSIRITTTVGLLLSSNLIDDPDTKQLGPLFLAAKNALDQGELEQAEELFLRLEKMKLPDPVRAMCLMLVGSIKVWQELPEEAIEYVKRAEALKSDMPILHFLWAAIHNQLDEPAKALDRLEKYTALLGEDADTWLQTGTALASLGRTQEALTAFRKGLDDDPDSVDNLLKLAELLPDDQKAELGERFAKLSEPKEWFESLAEQLITAEDDQAAEVLVATYRKLEPQDPNVDYYDAQVKMQREQYEEAAKLLKRAIPRVEDEEERGYYVDAFLEALLYAERPLQAYEESPDRRYAFCYIADDLAAGEDDESLEKLIAAHRKAVPDDPKLPFYEATLHSLRGDDEKAVKLLAQHREALETDEDLLWEFEDLLIRSLVRLKRFQEALKDAEIAAARDEDPWHLVLVHAAAGNVEKATEAFEKCLEQGYDVEDFAGDPEIGPALKAEAFKELRAKYPALEEDDRPPTSLVLLLREPRSLAANQLATAVHKAWGIKLSQNETDATEFITGKPPIFMISIKPGLFIVNVIGQPYFDDAQAFAEELNELHLRTAVLEHKAWLSVDAIGAPEDEEAKKKTYGHLGKLIAELAGDDCLAVYSTELERMHPYKEKIKETLRGPDPFSLFRDLAFDPVIRVESDSPEMKAAVAEARRRWPELVKAFSKRKPDQTFLVKAPFTEGENTEYMWAKVTGLEKETIRATLANEPMGLTKLKVDDPVTIAAKDVVDWMYNDGETLHGGFVEKLLR